MPYTDEEIQAEVQTMVLSTIRRPMTSLGTKDIQVTFSDVQEATAGVFLLNQPAPFYVVQLAANKVLESVSSEASLVTQLIDALQATGRRVLPVHNITPLSNANSALNDLETAVTNRTANFKTITTLPAYQRFKKNVDQFLSENGSNIKSNGDIVPTPQGAKTTIRSLLAQIQAAHPGLLTSVGYIQNALADYNAVNLPSLAASGTLTRARQNMSSLVAQLTPQLPADRLESLRQTILSLLTMQAVVTQVGTFKTPEEFFLLTGSGSAYSDATHPATPATLQATKPGPYQISGSPPLDIALDGGAATTVNLNDALYAELSGLFTENFVFTLDTQASLTSPTAGPYTFGLNNQLVMSFTHPALKTTVMVQVVLAAGPSSSAVVSSSINAQLAAQDLDTYYQAVANGAYVQIYALSNGPTYQVSVGFGSANSALGFVGGESSSGTTSNRALKIYVTIGATTSTYNMLFSAGTWSAASIAADINLYLGANFLATAQGATGKQYVNLRYINPTPFSATLTFPSSNSPAAAVLGFPVDTPVSAQAATARRVASDLNSRGIALIAGSVVLPAAGGSGLVGYGDINDPAFLGAYRMAGSGSVTSGGLVITLVVSGGGLLAAGVVSGDALVIRDGVNAGTVWTVQASGLTDTQLLAARTTGYTQTTAGFVQPAVAASVSVSVQDSSWAALGELVYIPTGGEYQVTGLPDLVTLVLTNTGAVGNAAPATLITTSKQVFVKGAVGSCSFDIGPDFTSIASTAVAEVLTGAGVGLYSVVSLSPRMPKAPYEFELDRILAGGANSTTRQPNLFSVNIGQEYLTVSSKDTTTASKVVLSNTAASLFFTSVPGVATGTSPWISLPEKVNGLGAGDTLELYTSNYNAPSSIYTITTVDTVTVGITPEISSTASFTFTQTSPPPFALLRSSDFEKYGVLTAGLTTWLAGTVNQSSYFRELARLVNIVLVEGNPTPVQVNDAVNQAKLLLYALTQTGSTTSLEYYLSSYQVPRVEPVDSLVQTYKEKGSGRAVDILLSGQFSTFFGLDVHSVSYSGAMLSQMRSVAQQDLPVRKTGRRASGRSQVIGSTDSPDFEYDHTDTEDVKSPDIPSTLERVPHTTDTSG